MTQKPDDCYRPRFTSDAPSGDTCFFDKSKVVMQVNEDNGANGPTGQIVCSECNAVTDCTVMGKCGKCYDEQNGGDEPSGDGSVESTDAEAESHAVKSCTSPTYTREELTELFMSHIYRYAGDRQQLKWDVTKVLDALIVLGEVKVRNNG